MLLENILKKEFLLMETFHNVIYGNIFGQRWEIRFSSSLVRNKTGQLFTKFLIYLAVLHLLMVFEETSTALENEAFLTTLESEDIFIRMVKLCATWANDGFLLYFIVHNRIRMILFTDFKIGKVLIFKCYLIFIVYLIVFVTQ